MSHSIHTARWIGQLSGQGWELHLFPSLDFGATHPELTGVTVHHSVYGRHRNSVRQGVQYRGLYVGSHPVAYLARRVLGHFLPAYRAWQLKRVIAKIKPDLIHSLEIQSAGYLVHTVSAGWKGKFPDWWVTNWGSDIYLFGRLPEHKERIRSVLEACTFYSCECNRDVMLARKFGFTGEAMPVQPNAGGFDLDRLQSVRSATPPSQRKLIMLKGYQNWAGRALVGLRALERCAELLAGYTIAIHAAEPDVVLAARLFAEKTGIPVRILDKGSSHQQILQVHAEARVSIALGIGDAISTSLLEAMVMGSFPIQSCTACADEWIDSGVNGLIVPPEDPELVEAAIRHAMTDNGMVDAAGSRNWSIARDRLEAAKLNAEAVAAYRLIAGRIPPRDATHDGR